MGKSFHITTFGCQMNEHDSEVLAGLLLAAGFTQAPSRREADIVIINTCSVRDNADKRFFGTLGQLKHQKEARGEAFTVCVCGCMMQQPYIVDTLRAKYPWVDVIFGTHNLHELPRLLDNLWTEKQKQLSVWPEGGPVQEGLPAARPLRHKAYVNITFGCNNFCTYCIVPYTRGRERSRRASDILAEVRALVADGVREIMLLGQNVNSYLGVEEDGRKTDFPALLRLLQGVKGLSRIRFMTSHPKDLSEDLIRAFVDCPKLGSYLHLPVQAGSSRVLQRMNRRYTREQYLALVERLRQAVPGIAISTDIIVGFPGETEEDFEETLTLCEAVRYDSAFTFLFSKRPGTPAAEDPDQVPEAVKHERFNRLVEVINRIAAEKNAACVGRVEEVLVDGPGKSGRGILCGRTPSFKLINFPGSPALIGQFARVRVTGSNTFSLTGELAGP